MSVSILSQKDKKENSLSSQSLLKGLKYKSHRILKPMASTNSICFNDRQITEQLMEELTRVKEVIQGYEQKSKQYDLSYKQGGIIKQLINLEEVIVSKDAEIKSINQEIKGLKSAKSHFQLPSPKKYHIESELFQLAEELRLQRTELLITIQHHQTQVRKYLNLKKATEKLQVKYKEKYSDRLISYWDFKERSEQSKRQQDNNKKRVSKQPKNLSRDKHETSIEQVFNQKSQNPNRTLKELQSKKESAETWLRNAKKKHSAKIFELNAQLEFVRDEDALLNEKIRQIQAQKSQMQTKFKLNLKRKSKYSTSDQRPSTSFISHFHA